MRVIYTPKGKVLETNPVFGPVMLTDALTKQLHTWTISTDAAGSDPCVTLMVVDFYFKDPDSKSRSENPHVTYPSALHASVEEELLVISDPRADLSKNPFKILAYKLKRIARHIFPQKSFNPDY
jgi:hypothetical protein